MAHAQLFTPPDVTSGKTSTPSTTSTTSNSSTTSTSSTVNTQSPIIQQTQPQTQDPGSLFAPPTTPNTKDISQSPVVTSSFTAPPQTQTTQQSQSSQQTGGDSAVQTERSNASFVERMIGDFIDGISNALVASGFDTVDQLVFAGDKAAVDVFATVTSGGTTVSEFDAVAPIYWGFFVLAWMILIGVAMFAGVRVSRGKSNPRIRSTIGDTVMNFGVGVIFICFSWFIVYYTCDWNYILARWLAPSNVSSSNLSSLTVTTGDYLTSVFIRLVLIAMSIFINILYVLRKFLLIGMVIVGPLVGVAWAAGNKKPFSIWVSETVTNALMPFSHAIVFATYFRLYAWDMQYNTGLFSKWWVSPVVLFFIIPVSALMRRIFSTILGQFMGISEEATAAGGIAAMTGMAGALALGGSLVSGAFRSGKGGAASNGAKALGNLANQGGGALQGGGSSPALGVNAAASHQASSPASIATGIGQISGTSSQGALSQIQGGLSQIGQSSSLSGGMNGSSLSGGSNPGGKGNLVNFPSNQPYGITNMQNKIGAGRSVGAAIGGTLGKFAGSAVGLGLDAGALAFTGRSTNFRQTLGRAGSNIGQGVGSAAGGIGGAVTGAAQSIRQEKQLARQTGMTPQERNIGTRQAFRQAMGASFQDNGQTSRQVRALQQRAANRRVLGNLAGAAFGADVSSKAGNYLYNRSMRKGLEKIGNVKER